MGIKAWRLFQFGWNLQFVETDVLYMNLYEQMEPESSTEITNIAGGSHAIFQNYVSDIKNQVEIKLKNVDFDENGTYLAVVKGRALSASDVKVNINYKDANESTKNIPIIFKAEKGEVYELSSEIFYAQIFVVQGIVGEQDLIVAFEDGTRFDFESMYFIEYGSTDKELGNAYYS